MNCWLVRYIAGLSMTVLIVNQLSAQLPDYHVQVFDESYGIRPVSMRKVIKDHRDFIWIMYPDRIQRFDGKQTKEFFLEEKMISMCCTKDNEIFASSTHHVYKFKDNQAGFAKLSVDSAKDLIMGSLFQLQNKPLWLSTSKGFFEWNESSRQFQKIGPATIRVDFKVEPDITGFYNTTLFFCSRDSVFAHNLSFNNRKAFSFKNIIGLFPVSSSLALITERGGYSYWLDCDKAIISPVELSYPDIKEANNSVFIRDVVQIGENDFLLASHSGLFHLQKNERRFRLLQLYYKGKPLEQTSLYLSLFRDSRKNVWLVHNTGLVVFNPDRETIGLIRSRQTEPQKSWQNSVRDFAADQKGNLWISTSNGFGYWDLQKNEITMYPVVRNATDRLNQPSVRGLIFDGKNLIVGTSPTGIWIYNPVTQKYRRPPCGNESTRILIEKDFIRHIYKLSNGNYFVLANHAYEMDAGDFRIRRLYVPVDPGAFFFGYQDSTNNVFTGTDKGLYVFDSNLVYLQTIPVKEPVWSLCEVRANELLVGTVNGLFNLNTLNGKWQLKNENPFFDKVNIETIVKDANGIFWMKCDEGLYRYDRQTRHADIFDGFNNIPGGSNFSNAVLRHSNGLLFLGGESGINYFYPEKIPEQKDSLVLSITSFTVDNNDTSYIDYTSPVRLKYFQNAVTIDFIAPYYGNSSRIQYRYMLQGVDTGWKSNGTANSIRFTSLASGNYVFKVQASSNGINWYEGNQRISFTVLPPFWKTWWFISISVLALATAVYIVIKRREKIFRATQQEKTKVQQLLAENLQYRLEVLQNKQKATEAKLQSMRLQMNPHFLFNALNSIQQMILSRDETVATRCLSKFSKLLRLVLIHSDKERITLKEELEMLRLYVELESFRFKEKFEYYITCDEDIDQEETLISTLLIQPFVENAIWHGLLHKDGDRRLTVHFFMNTNDILTCVIEDNGIGRESAQKIKETAAQENKHTGKGMTVTRERIQTLAEDLSDKNVLEIIDLKEENGNAAGTKVIIQIPV